MTTHKDRTVWNGPKACTESTQCPCVNSEKDVNTSLMSAIN